MVVLGPSLPTTASCSPTTPPSWSSSAELDGMLVHGIDFLRWGDDDRLVEFTVMVRPVKGLQALIGAMASQLGR